MKKTMSFAFVLLVLLPAVLSAQIQTAPELMRQAQSAKSDRFSFAEKKGAKIIPTPDGRSFYVYWEPPADKHPNPPVIVTLHGHASWAVDEFYLWFEEAQKRGYAVLALQWWFGGGEGPGDYYAPPEMYPVIADILRSHKVQPGNALLHGFSRGAANIYALTALDRKTGNNFFSVTIANSGGASMDFPFNRDITDGRLGPQIFSGTKWILYCGKKDENPDRDGCPAMHRTQNWIESQGGSILKLIEDPKSGHGGFHMNKKNLPAALDLFDQSRLKPAPPAKP